MIHICRIYVPRVATTTGTTRHGTFLTKFRNHFAKFLLIEHWIGDDIRSAGLFVVIIVVALLSCVFFLLGTIPSMVTNNLENIPFVSRLVYRTQIVRWWRWWSSSSYPKNYYYCCRYYVSPKSIVFRNRDVNHWTTTVTMRAKQSSLNATRTVVVPSAFESVVDNNTERGYNNDTNYSNDHHRRNNTVRVVPLLRDRRRRHYPHGRVSFFLRAGPNARIPSSSSSCC